MTYLHSETLLCAHIERPLLVVGLVIDYGTDLLHDADINKVLPDNQHMFLLLKVSLCHWLQRPPRVVEGRTFTAKT